MHPLLPPLHTNRPLERAGQHETALATLPKACKPLASGHLTLLVLFALLLGLGAVWGSYFTSHGSGDCAFPKGPVGAHHCTKLQHEQAAGSVQVEGKKDESQLLSPGTSRVNPRRNRFIFRMVSQESLKQLARSLGYYSPPTAPFSLTAYKIQIASLNNSTGTAVALLHSQNRSSPPTLSRERKQEQLGRGCQCAAPFLAGAPHTTRSPAASAE